MRVYWWIYGCCPRRDYIQPNRGGVRLDHVSAATELPILAGLPKVELAKLMADFEVLTYPKGTVIAQADGPQQWLYFVLRGDVEVTSDSAGQALPLMVLGAGSSFGETALKTERTPLESAKAISEVTLCRIPLSRFQPLLERDATLARNYNALLSAKLHSSLQELERTKRMLAAYVDEVWNAPPPLAEQEAVSLMEPGGHQPAAVESDRASPRLRLRQPVKISRQGVGLALSIVSSLVVFYLVDAQFAAAAAIFVWAAANWLLGTMPDYAVALTASTMLVLTNTASPAIAFSGFANPGWFLLLGVLGIGSAVSRSGLIYRLALHMLRILPPSYRGQSLALALTGLLFTPLLPSSNSRAAIGSPLARELSEAMRFPEKGRGSAGLAISSFLGFGQMYFLFLNGGNICMMAWTLMSDYTSRPITWSSWLWYALPLGLIMFVGSFLAIIIQFPPEPTAGVSRDLILSQIQILGPMTRNERLTTAVLVVMLGGFVTQPFHGIDPAWLALPGFLLLIAVGVIDKAGLKELDWGFLLLIGSLISLSDVTKAAGLTEGLTQWVGPLLQPLASQPALFLGLVAVLMLVVRLAIPLQPAVLIFTIALLPTATQIGFHPIVVVLVALALSNSWLIPQQNTMYLTVFSGTEERSFTHAQVRRLAVIHAGIAIIAVLGSVPFWRLWGLLAH
jgi:anion transporter